MNHLSNEAIEYARLQMRKYQLMSLNGEENGESLKGMKGDVRMSLKTRTSECCRYKSIA